MTDPAGLDESGELNLYQKLFDLMDEGYCVIKFLDGPEGPLSDYVHIQANAAYAANAGIPDVVGQRLRTMVPDEADAWIVRYGEVLRTGNPIRFEQKLIATGRHLELSAFRLGPFEDRLVAVLFKDVTARKTAEIALHELNRNLEARVAETIEERNLLGLIIEKTTAFVQVIDLDYRWRFLNQSSSDEFERVFGVRPEIGNRIVDTLFQAPGAASLLLSLWERAFTSGDFTETTSLEMPDGSTRSYEMHFARLRDEEGRISGAYQFAYDVTERFAARTRLKAAEDALRQSQKMEAVGQLTGGIAHDFNNLLAGISGSLEMMGVRLSQGRNSDVERYLSAAQGAARRAASLTHRLLAFSRRQTLSPVALNANRLVSDLLDLIQRTVGPSIEVEFVAASGLWTTMVDANQLENAIINLVINSRDAMPNGGKITVETGNKWIDDRIAGERAIDPGQYVTVCVSDTGTGIEKSIIDRVFDPFFTTKPVGQGTGLGLSMVYGFARQSHGYVRIYSEDRQGTMVCLYLPRHMGEEEQFTALPETFAGDQPASGNVLIVDDEPTVRMLAQDALADMGYSCTEAGDGPSALKIMEGGARFDLLITDVGLPGGMNGRVVADKIREIQPDIKVLFITGYAENAVLNHGHVQPGIEILTKPFSVTELGRRVRRLIDEAR